MFKPNLKNLNIKIFADGADQETMFTMYSKDYIGGLTTNPTLMRKSGVNDYKLFCKTILKVIKNKPLSFEVFSDNFDEMRQQAIQISSWGDNVYVKIPITNTKKEGCYDLVKELSYRGIKLNITAIMTNEQVSKVLNCLNPKVPSYISIFAGRIADTGRDPIVIMKNALKDMNTHPQAELIWASPRELYNIFQANEIGCHIITVTDDILKKIKMIGYDLEEYSLDTVKMFYNDSVVAGYKI